MGGDLLHYYVRWWTDRKHKSLINFLLKNARNFFELLNSMVEKVSEGKVGQLTPYNATTYGHGKNVDGEKLPLVLDSLCSSLLDLMLGDSEKNS